jgi:F-type H+-transporting ATPase subunit alpha
LDLAQYRELATFAQFGTADLDPATRAQLARGQLATEMLKQPQYQPLALAEEVIILFAVNEGLIEDLPIERCAAFQDELLRFISAGHADLVDAIARDRDITPETDTALTEAINNFKATFMA